MIKGDSERRGGANGMVRDWFPVCKVVASWTRNAQYASTIRRGAVALQTSAWWYFHFPYGGWYLSETRKCVVASAVLRSGQSTRFAIAAIRMLRCRHSACERSGTMTRSVCNRGSSICHGSVFPSCSEPHSNGWIHFRWCTESML